MYILGEFYDVPCIVTREDNNIVYITPVINHPHNDIENGQLYTHYHVDARFVGIRGVELEDGATYSSEARVMGDLEIFKLRFFHTSHAFITHSGNIDTSKMKHQCIVRGRCPHRGYDLSREPIIDGVIKCPLHGLEFDAETAKLIKKC